MVNCLFCDKIFSTKTNLDRHLSTNTCKSKLFENQLDMHNFINKAIVNNYNKCTINNNNNNINIKIEIQPVSKISFNDISDDTLYNAIKEYSKIEKITPNDIDNNIVSKSIPEAKFIISNLIKNSMCDKEKPENHSIKYVTKNPLTYSIVEKEDDNGDIITSIRGFKESVNILTDPVLNALKTKLRLFEKTLKTESKNAIKNGSEEELKYDYELYNKTIKALKNELNNKVVQNALKQFLKHDLLADINMKLSVY